LRQCSSGCRSLSGSCAAICCGGRAAVWMGRAARRAASWAPPLLLLCGAGEATLRTAIARGSTSSAQALLANATGLRGRRGARRAAARDDGQPLCSCDCCSVAARRPDEIVASAAIKCAPSGDHGADLCGEQGLCSAAQDDRILRDTMEDQSVDYQRFCLFECKPAEGVESPVRTQCIDLELQDVGKVVDASGNPVDPAIVYAHGPELRAADMAVGDPPARIAGPLPRLAPAAGAAAPAGQAASPGDPVAPRAASLVAAGPGAADEPPVPAGMEVVSTGYAGVVVGQQAARQ